MVDVISTEDSYADRRQVFKDIWATAMVMDEKDDILKKPKVIKTLRMDDDDKILIGQRKKERIKNLRAVCNKILDYCDRQDADEVFYQQMVGIGTDPILPHHSKKIKKLKTYRRKKKIVRAKSINGPVDTSASPPPERSDSAKSITKDDLHTRNKKIDFTAIKINRASIFRSSATYNPKANVDPDSSQENKKQDNEITNKTGVPRRRLVKKKHSKKKKISPNVSGEAAIWNLSDK